MRRDAAIDDAVIKDITMDVPVLEGFKSLALEDTEEVDTTKSGSVAIQSVVLLDEDRLLETTRDHVVKIDVEWEALEYVPSLDPGL